MRQTADAHYAVACDNVNMRQRSDLGGPAARVLLVSAAISLAVAACGGGRPSTTSTTTRTTTTTSRSTTSTTRTGGTSEIRTGPVRGRLVADNHAPTVDRAWWYTVTATSASSRPLSGTVAIQFVFAGEVVGRDTPATHRLTDGRWRDNLKFPATSVGQPLTVRAVVRTAAGTITLDWPIIVQQ